MIIIFGLIILVAAVVAGVAGVLTNAGSGHELTNFSVLGYHVTGSTGTLFLYGIVVGAIGMVGMSLLLASARRTSRRGRSARKGLRQSRSETAAATQDRDHLLDQRDTARSYTASTLGSDAPAGGRQIQHESWWARLRMRRSQPAQGQAAARAPESQASQPAPSAPEPQNGQHAAAPAVTPAAQPAPEVPGRASVPAE